MLCSPTRLCLDLFLWTSEGFKDNFVASLNHSKDEYSNEDYDCALLSVPCESSIVKAVFSFNADLTFWFDLVVVQILTALMVVMGIVGNFINIIILSKHNIANDSTNSLLLGLAVADLTTLLLNGALMSCIYLCLMDELTAIVAYNNVFYYTVIINRSLNTLSLDFVAVISVQRAFAVLFPFKIKTIFSQRNTNIIIAAIVVTFFSFVPSLTSFSHQEVYHPYFNDYVSLGYKYEWDYNVIVNYFFYYTAFRSGLGVLIISIFGSLTVIKLKLQSKSRASLQASETSSRDSTPKMSVGERKTTMMSLTVCFISFLVFSFSLATLIVIQVFPESLFQNSLYCVLTYFLSFLFAINASVNFFIYFGMSAKFRDACKELFHPGKKK